MTDLSWGSMLHKQYLTFIVESYKQKERERERVMKHMKHMSNKKLTIVTVSALSFEKNGNQL